jgi:hypothetical protein
MCSSSMTLSPDGVEGKQMFERFVNLVGIE